MNARPLFRALGHQQYLRFGLRDRLIRLYHHPERAKPEEFTVPFFGQVYRGEFGTYLDWSVFYYGAYAREELRLIGDILELMDAPVVFDVGANIGHHTLFAAQYSARVYAFEPFEKVLGKLRQKISDNRLTNIEVCPFGLGEKKRHGNLSCAGRREHRRGKLFVQ